MRIPFILMLVLPLLASACMTKEKRHIEAYLEAEKESRSHRAAFLKGYGDIMDFLNTAEEKDLPSLEELAALRTHQKSRVETLEKIALPLPKLAPIHDQLLAAERRILNGIIAFETGEKVNRKEPLKLRTPHLDAQAHNENFRSKMNVDETNDEPVNIVFTEEDLQNFDIGMVCYFVS